MITIFRCEGVTRFGMSNEWAVVSFINFSAAPEGMSERLFRTNRTSIRQYFDMMTDEPDQFEEGKEYQIEFTPLT